MPDTRKNAETINELLAAGLGGHISRREMLKRATGLGLSAPMIWLLLRAAPAEEPMRNGVAPRENLSGNETNPD
jgi:hypothetical protein